MSRGATSDRSRGWDLDPLVDVRGERVRVAIEGHPAGWTRKTLAAELQRRGVQPASRQELNYICSGVRKRCRKSMRRELAKVFGVPEGWLAGGEDRLPYAPLPNAIVYREEGEPESPLFAGLPADDAPLSIQFATNDLLSKCNRALRRDFHVWFGDDRGDKEFSKWGLDLLRAIFEFSAGQSWRDVYLLPSPNLDDHIWVSWIHNAGLALTPWLKGRARLNVGLFVQLILCFPAQDARIQRLVKGYRAYCRASGIPLPSWVPRRARKPA